MKYWNKSSRYRRAISNADGSLRNLQRLNRLINGKNPFKSSPFEDVQVMMIKDAEDYFLKQALMPNPWIQLLMADKFNPDTHTPVYK
jgi:hypothetical protein